MKNIVVRWSTVKDICDFMWFVLSLKYVQKTTTQQMNSLMFISKYINYEHSASRVDVNDIQREYFSWRIENAHVGSELSLVWLPIQNTTIIREEPITVWLM